jgi:hypothetical protein
MGDDRPHLHGGRSPPPQHPAEGQARRDKAELREHEQGQEIGCCRYVGLQVSGVEQKETPFNQVEHEGAADVDDGLGGQEPQVADFLLVQHLDVLGGGSSGVVVSWDEKDRMEKGHHGRQTRRMTCLGQVVDAPHEHHDEKEGQGEVEKEDKYQPEES